VIKDADTARVEDLGSSNGTYHNGQRIQGSVEVHPGDSVEVGPVVFVVQVDGVPADDELQPITDRAGHSQHPLVDDSAFGGEVTETPANADSFAGGQGETATEAHPLEESAEGDSPIPMAGDEPTLDIDLSDDQGHQGQPLSEDELLLDLNTHDEREKH
jgi:pSer/pThr/pTyr-binding forkhead associated (FHA) protein